MSPVPESPSHVQEHLVCMCCSSVTRQNNSANLSDSRDAVPVVFDVRSEVHESSVVDVRFSTFEWSPDVDSGTVIKGSPVVVQGCRCGYSHEEEDLVFGVLYPWFVRGLFLQLRYWSARPTSQVVSCSMFSYASWSASC